MQNVVNVATIQNSNARFSIRKYPYPTKPASIKNKTFKILRKQKYPAEDKFGGDLSSAV